MGTEIERKFLVKNDRWRGKGPATDYRQGYLTSDPRRTVRVRIAGDRAWLTIKSKPVGAVRSEFEYEIPPADAEQLLTLCDEPLIEKTRHRIDHHGRLWEVDEFHGANAGLVVVECELEHEDEAIDPPDWLGREVTGDERYYNASLIASPYTSWSQAE